jgi:site-specific recombinase XerC
MQAAICKKKGGRATRDRMKSTFHQLAKIAKTGRWGDVSPASLTHKQLAKYVEIRVEKGISAHSIQTEVSSIRRALEGAGRHIDVVKIFTSESLGVPSCSRKGTGTAIDENVYQTALQNADAVTSAMMRLEKNIGLRINEVIECTGSLKSWDKVLQLGGVELTVSSGTKGGKVRSVHIHPQHREAVHAAVVAALAVTTGGKKHFFNDAKSGRAALDMYSKNLAALGVKGKNSSHSMRRAFAVKQYCAYLDAGYENKAALARLSLDLGHGDGRGRWVWNNYISTTLLGD